MICTYNFSMYIHAKERKKEKKKERKKAFIYLFKVSEIENLNILKSTLQANSPITKNSPFRKSLFRGYYFLSNNRFGFHLIARYPSEISIKFQPCHQNMMLGWNIIKRCIANIFFFRKSKLKQWDILRKHTLKKQVPIGYRNWEENMINILYAIKRFI